MRTRLICGIFLLLFSISAQAKDAIVINDAWISEAPPTAKVNAGYLSIENKTNTEIQLIKVRSNDYGRIEMHRSIIVNETAQMRTQTSISIAAKERFAFRPGGYHLMLFEPTKYFKAGEVIDLQFEFSDGATIPVRAEVRKLKTPHHHAHH